MKVNSNVTLTYVGDGELRAQLEQESFDFKENIFSMDGQMILQNYSLNMIYLCFLLCGKECLWLYWRH